MLGGARAGADPSRCFSPRRRTVRNHRPPLETGFIIEFARSLAAWHPANIHSRRCNLSKRLAEGVNTHVLPIFLLSTSPRFASSMRSLRGFVDDPMAIAMRLDGVVLARMAQGVTDKLALAMVQECESLKLLLGLV